MKKCIYNLECFLQESTTKLFLKLNKYQVSKYLLTGNKLKDIKKVLYDTLWEMDTEKLHLEPDLLYRWSLGHDSNLLFQEFQKFINKKSLGVQGLILMNILEILLDVDTFIDILIPTNFKIQIEPEAKHYLISNCPEKILVKLKIKFNDTFKIFEDVVISEKIGEIRPELPFFNHTIKYLELTPENCEFFDVNLVNINIVKSIGYSAKLV